VQNSLEKLRIALMSRDTARTQLATLESAPDDELDRKAIDEAREKLTRREAALEQARAYVGREIEDAKKARDEATRRLAEAKSARAADFESAEEHRHNATIRRGDMLVGYLERAFAADDPEEVRGILKSVQEEATRIPSPYSLDASRFGDWPGPSVPERLIMLFKEARRPGSKKPILISGGIMLVLAVLVFGGAAISMLRGDRADANPVGMGEAVVPVLVDAADDTVRIEVTLEYDDSVLTALDVRKGLLGTLSTLESDISTTGVVEFVVTDSAGVVGSGDLVLVVFKVEHIITEPTPIVIASAAAVDKSGGLSRVRLEDGWLDTACLVNYAPTVHFE